MATVQVPRYILDRYNIGDIVNKDGVERQVLDSQTTDRRSNGQLDGWEWEKSDEFAV